MPRFQCAAGGLKVQGLSAKLPGYAAETSAAALPSCRQKCGMRLDPSQRVDNYVIRVDFVHGS